MIHEQTTLVTLVLKIFDINKTLGCFIMILKNEQIPRNSQIPQYLYFYHVG